MESTLLKRFEYLVGSLKIFFFHLNGAVLSWAGFFFDAVVVCGLKRFLCCQGWIARYWGDCRTWKKPDAKSECVITIRFVLFWSGKHA